MVRLFLLKISLENGFSIVKRFHLWLELWLKKNKKVGIEQSLRGEKAMGDLQAEDVE